MSPSLPQLVQQKDQTSQIPTLPHYHSQAQVPPTHTKTKTTPSVTYNSNISQKKTEHSFIPLSAATLDL